MVALSGRHVVRPGSQVVFSTVAPVWGYLVGVIFVVEVLVGFMFIGGGHVAGVESSRQVHLDHHRLGVFQRHTLLGSQVLALLYQLAVGGILARLLQAGLAIVAFALRTDWVVGLQVRLVGYHVLRDA